jgi:acetyl-CoA carboxylase carboxyl transferase subunit beta
MSWLAKWKSGLGIGSKKSVPDGVWIKCEGRGADLGLGCGQTLYQRDLEENLWVCPLCGFHHRILVTEYLNILLDTETFVPMFENVHSLDPLRFRAAKKYSDKLRDDEKKTGERSAFVAGSGLIDGLRTAIGGTHFGFVGGSLGSAEGEKIRLLIDYAEENRVPLVIISQSGGARMQEASLSLMQMAKTSARLAEFSESGLPYISLLTNPTTGGVTASFAMLGDVHIAEPNALIGFAGGRVRDTIKEDLPEGFQRAEFLMEHGFVDRVVVRSELKAEISRLLRLLSPSQVA